MEFLSNDMLGPAVAAGLIILAGFTSLITAAFGAGGGLLLLVVMASILPMAVVIPVHGLVQLGSNANRAVMTFRHIDYKLLLYFSLGGSFGALLSSHLVMLIPLEMMKVFIAIFVLYILWLKPPSTAPSSHLVDGIYGLFTTFLSMFVGASGPLVGSFLFSKGYDKLRFTASFSSCLTFQHSVKAIVYTVVGFSFWQWLPLVIAMILSGTLGTWLGLRLLKKLPEQKFSFIFKVILTVLSIQLGWQFIASL
ncbi:sulfite exporter TauE/SafE family protein [Flavobacterium sp. W21_SRS_FM6]|uniref:sulfite exporter TauE/SafE family protein n=1 Tax=Flavobacterium sp. W21_SRS_FM6 TaxID=3240268 RepID=UPI003F9069B1